MYRADLVFISGMIAQGESARRMIARCKAAGKTVVAGGPLFTSAHADYEEVDHFVLNEAEVALPDFLHDFESGCAKRIYSSLCFPDLMATIYAPRPYYRRMRTFLREFHPAKTSFHLDLRELAAFLRSVPSLGVIGRERFQYWLLLAWASYRRPRLLPVAVKLAIFGHHFRCCAKALAR